MLKIRVLVDNNENPSMRMATGWGLSLLIESGGYMILWDTGPDPKLLRENMEVLGISPLDIDIIFISHEHHDHIGGLKYLAETTRGVKVYIPYGVSEQIKESIIKMGFKLHEVDTASAVGCGILSIGQLYGPPYEQSIIALNGKAVLLVGCSHPGIINIVRRAAALGYKPEYVIGGLHLYKHSEEEIIQTLNSLFDLGVEKVSPMHCSGDEIRDIMTRRFRDRLLKLYVGSEISV